MPSNPREFGIAQSAERGGVQQFDDMFIFHLSPALSKLGDELFPAPASNFSTSARIRRRARKARTLIFDSDQPVMAATSLTEVPSPSIRIRINRSSGGSLSKIFSARSAATRSSSTERSLMAAWFASRS